MTWIISLISATSIIIIAVAVGVAFIGNDVHVEDNIFEITGPYGVEWDISDIESVEKLNQLPEILYRSDGIAAANQQVDRLQLQEPYGNRRLHLGRTSRS